MFVLDHAVSENTKYTELIRVTHPSDFMITSQIATRWMDGDDFLVWASRQRDADSVMDYDV